MHSIAKRNSFFILELYLVIHYYTTKKREPTAIGSFGLPHPQFPIYAESSRINVSVSHYSRKTVFQCGRLNESSNKANAYSICSARLRLSSLFYAAEVSYLAVNVGKRRIIELLLVSFQSIAGMIRHISWQTLFRPGMLDNQTSSRSLA